MKIANHKSLRSEIVLKNNKGWYLEKLIIILPVFLFLISFTIGRYSVSVKDLLYIFYAKTIGLHQTWTTVVDTVIFQIRLPRIIIAMLIGSALSLSGATYQGLFKNPMVSPDILGASAGAGFGAAIAMLLNFNIIGIQIMAFAFGIGAVTLTYAVSRAVGRNNTGILILVLTGMVVTTLFSSFVSLIKYVADPDSKLPAITFWLMGGLSAVTYRDVIFLIISILIGATPIILLKWKLNVISFGEEEAKSMGVNTDRIRLILILCSTLITAASVSIGGMIGWVGLIIPHLSRMIVGPNYKALLPASILIGSSYLLVVDDIARSLCAMEIPLGILTSIVGAPFFMIMIINGRREWL